MFFLISKILSFLITPVFWILIFLILAVFSKNAKRKKIALISATFLFFFFSNSFIFEEFMRKWEVPAISQKGMSRYDVGIVLGGMSSFDTTLNRIKFTQSTDRLLQALELYQKGIIKKILISGGSGSLILSDKEALYLKPYLLALKIPEEDILIESESKNTRENALMSAQLLKKLYPDGGKYLLITSGFHMRRSLACFEKVGLKTYPYSTDRYSGKRRYYFDHLLFPNTLTLVGWDVMLHEWLGCITYKTAGYI